MNSKKKILFVISTLRMGGAEKSLVSLLKMLNTYKLDVDLFVFESEGVLESEVPEWVNIIPTDPITRGMTLEFRKYIGGVLKKLKLRAAFARMKMSIDAKQKKQRKFNWNEVKNYIPMQKKKYDVAISYLEDFPAFYVIDKVIADKKIGWIHTDFSKIKVHKEETKYYERFDKIVTISDICLESFIKVFPKTRDKICVIENVVSKEEIIKKSSEKMTDVWEKKDKTHIITVGRLEYIKGIDIAVETANILKERRVPFCWHVFGKGTLEEELKKAIDKYELNKEFLLEGIRENPYPYMKEADIVVQPSRTEGKSIVLDEAKILGKAIVVTNYPSVLDQIQDKKTGLISEINSTALANKIEEVINDSNLKKELEKNAANEKNNSVLVVEKFYQLIV